MNRPRGATLGHGITHVARVTVVRLKVVRLAVVLAVFAVIAGCGGAGADGAEMDDEPGMQASGTTGQSDRCQLLTAAEVESAIGPHGGGSATGEWGNQGCRWAATAAQDIQGQPTWHDAIEVAVFDGHRLEWAREQVRGEPVSGVAQGATYDDTYGELWFECAGNRLCVVKARTSFSAGRQQKAEELARLVHSRVQAP